MRAAQFGVELNKLEVRVDSLSDDRDMLGIDNSIPAGPLSMKFSIRIGAEGVSEELLHEIVDWAEEHSPVGEPLTRIMPIEYVVDIV
ncbi:MAG: hypothetical protein IT316_06385 [Anaerolineales bacterium]|nr:hypothetical protein [Anaerolineales bacterium]